MRRPRRSGRLDQRADPSGPLRQGDRIGLGQVVLGEQHRALQADLVGLQLQGLAIVDHRLRDEPRPVERLPEIGQHHRRIRIEHQRLAQPRDGLVEPAEAAIGDAQVGHGETMFGLDRQRLLDQRDGALVVARLQRQHTLEVQRTGVARLLAEDAVVEPGGLAAPALLVQPDGRAVEIIERRRHGRR